MSFLQYRWFPHAVAILFVCLGIALAATKSPWCDEGWFANAAYNLANHGHMGSTLQEPSGHYLNAYLSGIQERTYIVPPVYLVTLAGWLKIWGNSLLAMRGYAIFWGLVALGAFGYLVQLLTGDRRLASLAAGMTAIDFTYLFTATDVRMESMVLGLCLGSWVAYLHWRETNLARAVLVSHVLLALGCFAHPNAAFFGVGWLYLFWKHDRARVSWRLLALSAVPYALLAGAWGVYIGESPQDFSAQFFANAGESHRFKFFFKPWLNLFYEVMVRYLGHFGVYSLWANPMPGFTLLIPVFYAAALWQCGWNRGLRRRLGGLWPLGASIVLLLTFVMSYKVQNYVTYTIPFWNAMVAAWLLHGMTSQKAQMYLALFAAVQLGALGMRVKSNPQGTDYARAAEAMSRQMRQGKSLIAPASMGFAVGFAGFRDDARLGRWSGQRPDVLVVDHWYSLFQKSYGDKEPGSDRHVKKMLTEEYTPSEQFGDYRLYTRKRFVAHQEKR